MSDITLAVRRVLLSPSFKFCLIGALIIILLLPLTLAGALVYERAGRATDVRNEVARAWGLPQKLTGPFIVVPYTVKVVTKNGDKNVETVQERHAIFTPETLSIKADTTSSTLHRGIYDVSVYRAGVTLSGRFGAPDIGQIVPDPQLVRWNDAVLALGLSAVSGLKETASIRIDDKVDVPFAPSIGVAGMTASGVHARLISAGTVGPVENDGPLRAFSFETKLVFSGSGELMFAPAAQDTRVAMVSDWPSPSFTGAFLPVDRSVKTDGFTADWRVPHLARSVPSAWSDNENGIERVQPYLFGVSFYQPIDFYDLVNRSVKYGVLFLASAFMGVFVLEVVSAKRVHWVQYLFTGLALVFFFVLLLSFAEHIGFSLSYLMASVATGGMLAIYVARALGSPRDGILMAVLFAILFGLLYFILQLEDYALLAGALLGFVGLTIVMFTTLKVDWSGGGSQQT